MGVGVLLKQALGKVAPSVFLYRGRARDASSVAITFDDGPHPENSERLLDALDSEQAKASFFLQGKEAEKYPLLVRAIHARGHEICNHGYLHQRPGDAGTAAYIEGALRTRAILQDATGASTGSLFRPPYGEISGRALLGLAQKGFRVVHWSVDLGDSFINDARELVKRAEQAPVRAGDILLFHDDQPHTVQAMPAILRTLKARSLGFTSIEAMWRTRG